MQHNSEDNDASKSIAERFNRFFLLKLEKLKQNIDKNDTDPLENVDDAPDEITDFRQVSDNDIEQIILHIKDVGVKIGSLMHLKTMA